MVAVADTESVPASSCTATVTLENTGVLFENVSVPDGPATLTTTGIELPNVMLIDAEEPPVPDVSKYCPQNGLGVTSVREGLTESTHTSAVSEPTARLRSVTETVSSVGVTRLKLESVSDSGNVTVLLLNVIRLPPEHTGVVAESDVTVVVAFWMSV